MQQTTLWQILEALPSSALLEIEKMTRSPFFNQRKDVEQLYAGLRKYLKLKKVPVREALCAEIWPETPLENAAFRLSLHLLQQLVLRYLQIKKLEEDDGQQAIFRARALRGLSLDQLAHETLSRSEKYFMESPRQDPEFQEQKFQYMVELLRTSGGGARTRNLNLQQLSDQLDKSWFLKKMKTAAELLSHQTVYKVEYNYGTLDLLLQHLQAHPNILQSQEMSLYYNCCMALRFPDQSEYFQTMKPHLMNVEHFLPPDECREVVLLAINFCIRRLNAGNETYAQEGLQLYARALEKGYLFEKGELDRFTFRNVVAMGLMMHSYDWVEQFIRSNAEKIALPYRESMVSFSLARLAYSRKNYSEAMVLLQKADYDDLLLSLAAKTLLMKIYFEAEELRLLDALLDSMTIFLRRKKIIGYHKQNYLNIVKFGRKLSALNRYDRVAVANFKKAVETAPHLTERSWFLGQIG
jgi:tetratricopeptide (TPR) repeat protein